MENKQVISTRRLVLTALMAALTFVGSWIRITLPVAIGSTTAFHLGNIFCALSGLLLGPWYGALAAGLGSAIYDMTNPLYLPEAWITFLFKGIYGLLPGLIVWSGKKVWSSKKAFLGTAAGAVAYALLYLGKNFFYSDQLVRGMTAPAAMTALIGRLPATVFNAVVAILFAPILALAIRKALERNHLFLPGMQEPQQ